MLIDYHVGDSLEVGSVYGRREHAELVVPILKRLGFDAFIARQSHSRRRVWDVVETVE